MTLSLRRTISFLILTLLSVVVVIVGSVIVVRETNKAKQAYNNFLRKTQSPQQAQILKEQIKEIGEENISLFENSMPKFSPEDSSTFLPFFKTVEDLDTEFKITHNLKLDQEPAIDENGIPYLGFNLSFKATVGQLTEYLKRLNELPFFIELNSLTISDAVNIRGESQISIQARLYVRQ